MGGSSAFDAASPLSDDEIRALRKSIVDGLKGNSPSTVVDALDCLNEWTATVTSLKTTEIGLYINKCRKDANASEKIKGKCKALLQKWKKDVDLSTSDAPNSSQHHGKAHHDDLKRRESAQIRKSQSNISVDTSQNGGDSREETPVSADGPKKERTVANDGIKYQRTGDSMRDKSIEMIYKGLATETEEDGESVVRKAVRIEHYVQKRYPAISSDYQSRIRSMVQNVIGKNNLELKFNVLSGVISEEKFAAMSKDEMASEDFRKAAEEAFKQNLQDAMVAADTSATTDQFKCGKCKFRKAKYYQMQTRSADEPMTTFVTCLNCNHRWKFC